MLIDQLAEGAAPLAALRRLDGRPYFGYELDREGAARALDLSAVALRVAVHRLRGRYRELLRAEIAETLSDPADVDAEMRHLVAALRGK